MSAVPSLTTTAGQQYRSDPAAPEAPRREGQLGVDLLVVGVLVLAGALVRFSQLGPSSLWLDDAWLAMASKAEGLGELVTVGVTAPGFAAALAGVVGVAGFSSTSAQALPFVLGVAAAPVLYLVARRLGLGWAPALVGAALVLAAPVHIVYSGRVKPFTADALLAALVLWRGWRVVERPDDAWRWCWLALVAVGSVMVSAAVAPSVAGAYLAGLTAAGLAAAGLHRPRRLVPGLVSVAAFAGFAVVWWWAIVRHASTPSLRAYWSDHYLDLGSGPSEAIADLGGSMANLLDGFSGLPVAVSITALVLAVVVVVARRPLIGLLLIVPLVASIALAALDMAPFGGGRTDIHLYPSLALLVALACHLGLRRFPAPGTWAAPAVILVAIAATVRPPPPYPASDLRPLVALVESSARPDDAIAVYSASRWAHALYTDGPVDLRADPTSPNGFAAVALDSRVSVLRPHRDDPSGLRPEVAAITADHDRVWLLSSHTSDDFAVLEQSFGEQGYEATRTEDRPGASVTLWTRNGR